MKLYIAGPMTGYPQFNIPSFDQAARRLRADGYEVVSPAELDNPETRRLALLSPDGAPGSGSANGETWGDFLARDVKLITDGGINAIAVLPGWGLSRGARLETFVGNRMVGMPILWAATLAPVTTYQLVRAWTGEGMFIDLCDALARGEAVA